MDRLPVETFNLPVAEIRRGYRSAVYFWRAKKTLEKFLPEQEVTMQVFQKNNAVLCGVDEALAIIKSCSGRYTNPEKAYDVFDQYMVTRKEAAAAPNHVARANWMRDLVYLEQELDLLWEPGWEKLDVHALYDGNHIEPWEPVIQIDGPLSEIVHLESVYLGVLARRTKIATNTRRVVEAANGKPVLFFADRFDHYATQGGDGYAAYLGGAKGVASDAMGEWYFETGLGTMPHALIAAFEGNVVDASAAFSETIPDTNLVALVDFNNDCVADALSCADAFGEQLWGVRLDTSENMVDRSIADQWQDWGPEAAAEGFGYVPRYMPGDFKPTGVNIPLVHNVRDALDANGYEHVKILVSGGFNPEKIAAFEAGAAPVDSYAVGSSLLSGSNDFTADVVRPVAKHGRWFRENPRLEKVY